MIGFLGNELVARYRIRVGRKIGSAALVADGLHARTDGFTSLAVLLGAGGVAIGWDWADPVVGLVITVAILAVLRGAAREICRDRTDIRLLGQERDQETGLPIHRLLRVIASRAPGAVLRWPIGVHDRAR